MAEPLKNIYNDQFLNDFSEVLGKVIRNFNDEAFLLNFKNEEWEQYSLKERMSFLTNITDACLPFSYKDKLDTIFEIIEQLRLKGIKSQNLEYIFLCDIVTNHGLNDLGTSIKAMEVITQFTSFEFAGRLFIVKYPLEMMNQMEIWTRHPSEYVRRFATEGCRPRLPWGLQLKQFVTNPEPIFPVLEGLKNDPSEYVRKSVANNLNDISKNHSTLVLEIAKKWVGSSKNTDWVVKHGLRTLLKNGNSTALEFFGHSKETKFSFLSLELNKESLKLNDTLSFSFSIVNHESKSSKFRLEYYIHFMKSNGELSKKIFKILEVTLNSHEKTTFSKKHLFKNLTTRKHYEGRHLLSIVINGSEQAAREFYLSE